MTVILYLLSRSSYPFMASILSAFPLMISIGLYQLHENVPESELLRLTTLMLGTTLTLGLFVLTFREQVSKTNFWPAWITGIIVWLLTTSIIYYAWSK